MAYTIRLRRGLAADWTSLNPTLSDGEPGYETDTKLLKIGNGTTPWNALAYVVSSASGTPGPPGDEGPPGPPGPGAVTSLLPCVRKWNDTANAYLPDPGPTGYAFTIFHDTEIPLINDNSPGTHDPMTNGRGGVDGDEWLK